MTKTPHTLTPLQAARLRAADGLASTEDRRLLAEDGAEEDQLRQEQGEWLAGVRGALAAPPLNEDLWPAIRDRLSLSEAAPSRGEVRQALASCDPSPLAAPDVSGAVLRALGHGAAGLSVGAALREAAGSEPDVSTAVLRALGGEALPVGPALAEAAGEAPDVSRDVLLAAELREEEPGVRDALLAAAGEPPDVAASVLARLDGSAPHLGAALTAAAGPAPDVSDAVLAALAVGGATASGAGGPAAANTAPDRFPVWTALAVGALALAAAALFFVGPGPQDAEPISFELAAVNEVEIEDLTVGDAAMVQVLQFEEDAPTIIFVDVPEEASAGGDEGATL